MCNGLSLIIVYAFISSLSLCALLIFPIIHKYQLLIIKKNLNHYISINKKRLTVEYGIKEKKEEIKVLLYSQKKLI